MELPEFRSCGARWRVQFADPGWTCHGTGLVKLMDGTLDQHGNRIPLVGPESALAEIMADAWADAYHPEPFAGGDHLHWARAPQGLRVSQR